MYHHVIKVEHGTRGSCGTLHNHKASNGSKEFPIIVASQDEVKNELSKGMKTSPVEEFSRGVFVHKRRRRFQLPKVGMHPNPKVGIKSN
jgi:hypothetical protein